MFKASNNEAAYTGPIVGLGLCYFTGADSVKAYSNSQPVASQLNDEYQTKHNMMTAYVREVGEATSWLKNFSVVLIPKSKYY